MISDEETETRGIQVSTRPDDPVRGEPGELPGDVGEDIDGVGNDEENGIRRVTGERGYDVLEEGDVPLEKVKPGFAGDLACTGGDDAKIGADSDRVVHRGVDRYAGEEGGGVLEIKHLATELIGFVVDDDELVGEVLSEDGLSDGHSDIAGADH